MKDKILKNKKVIIPVVSILLILVIVGVSFAYYSATVNKVNETETTIRTNGLAIRFNGTKEISYQNMIPGDSFTKTFTVTNESNKTVDFNIYMDSITNEYNEDLVYTIVDDLNTTIVSESKLPNTNTSKNYLKTGIQIASGATRTYTMTIEYKYLANEPQNDYQGKVFNATLGIDTNVNAIANSDLTLSLKSVNANDIPDGGSVTRQFTVTNTTDEAQKYDVKLVDVTNTYANGVTYTLTKNNTQVISSTTLPSNDTTILSDQLLLVGATDTYVMTISYDSTMGYLEGFMLLSNGTNEFNAGIRIDSTKAGVVKTIGEKINLANVADNTSVTKSVTINNYSTKAKTFDLAVNEVVENYTTKLQYTVRKNNVVVTSGETTSASTKVLDNVSIAANGTETYEIEIIRPVFTCLGENCPKCIRATTLHTDTCRSNAGCTNGNRYTVNSTITFGNQTTVSGQLNAGDAFDCDVNQDGTYDATNERFYYVSESFRNGEFSDSIVTLIYSKNYASSVKYSASSGYSPDTARSQLPNTNTWKNVSLELGTTRNIYYSGGNNDSVSVSNFSYEGYAARLLTIQEMKRGCPTAQIDAYRTICPWLLDNSSFTNPSYAASSSYYWLENTGGLVQTDSERYVSYYRDVDYSVRPVIEVSTSDINY